MVQTQESEGVKTFKKIRDKLGHSANRMAKLLGMSQQSYEYLEKKGQSIRVDILVRAIKLHSGKSKSDLSQLLDWLEEDAIKVEKETEKASKAESVEPIKLGKGKK